MSKHLWEADHPYYMSEGNYFSNDCHTSYATWAEFIAAFGDADMDYNWFVRWDWLEGEEWGAGEYNGDDYYRNGRFMLQRIAQRKGLLDTHEISVCRADEAAIIKFLAPRWEHMQEMWVPLSSVGQSLIFDAPTGDKP